jgi:hypothetical protein
LANRLRADPRDKQAKRDEGDDYDAAKRPSITTEAEQPRRQAARGHRYL